MWCNEPPPDSALSTVQLGERSLSDGVVWYFVRVHYYAVDNYIDWIFYADKAVAEKWADDFVKRTGFTRLEYTAERGSNENLRQQEDREGA